MFPALFETRAFPSLIHGCIFPDLWVKVPEEQSWYLLFSHEDVSRRSVPSAAEWYHLPMMLAWGQRLILYRICRICGIVSLLVCVICFFGD